MSPADPAQAGAARPSSFRLRLALLLGGTALQQQLAAVSARVDDGGSGGAGAGWTSFAGGPNDRPTAELFQQYADALEAWRKNPIAKRIVDCITDYVLGDGMTPVAPGQMGQFLARWWTHPLNALDRRMPELCEELTRAGDLFLTFHRNPIDGISYVRPVPKDRILRIDTLPNDWETEIAYHELQDTAQPRTWLSPAHPNAAEADAVMVHYAVNRVVGALMGESDLATMIPWLLRYSRLIEDRVRLHWATRAFLWIVTVPSNLVTAKKEQYRTPPDSGSIIVKDDGEKWESVAPDLRAFDAQFDTRAVRQMIDAGSGLPPHWRGEAHDVSLATAEAMEHSASRHLRRRQLYVRYLVADMAHVAYSRAWQLGKVRPKPNLQSISVETTDIDRVDNLELANAAHTIAQALEILARIVDVRAQQAASPSPTLRRLMLRMIMRFAGEKLDETQVETIMRELEPEAQKPGLSEQPGFSGFSAPQEGNSR